MKKVIELNTQEKKKICEVFGVSKVTLWSALTYKTNSGMARTLRATALEHGGHEIIIQEKKSYLDFETTFETADEIMTQKFSDRVIIKVHIPTNKVCVLVDGVEKIRESDVTATRLMQLQVQAADANKLLN